MNEEKIKQLLNKSDLIKYSYRTSWSADYLCDDIDRMSAFNGILYKYNLNRKVYLYRSIRNQFKLIAIISERGIKTV